VAEALAIEREDKFKKYKQWADLKRIWHDLEKKAAIAEVPFSQEKILEVLKDTFCL
jgi:hypothetical protein